MYEILDWFATNGQFVQIFALVTGVVYMILQIFQNRLMWYVDLLTAGAALMIALFNSDSGSWAPLWAQAAMNSYFIVMAVIGIFTWKRYSKLSDGALHVVRLHRKEGVTSAIFALAGAPLLCLILSLTNDPEPFADGLSMTFSIIAAWFLTRSHVEQWVMWIIADLLVIVLYANQGAWWMVALYYCYIISSVIGYTHWRKNGTYVEA